MARSDLTGKLGLECQLAVDLLDLALAVRQRRIGTARTRYNAPLNLAFC
jgi:hypothetical protein